METFLCLFLSVKTFFSLSSTGSSAGFEAYERVLHWLLKEQNLITMDLIRFCIPAQ